MENRLVPEIRFDGYADQWKQQKVGDVADFSKGHGYSKDDLVEVGTPIILYGRLYTKYQVVISEVDTFALDNSGSVYSTGKEVIVPSSGETAEDIARASAIVKSGILLGGDINIIHPYDNINSIFLALCLCNGKQHRELSKRAQGKSIVHLQITDIKEVAIFYPSIVEQIKISSFFRNLDSLINLRQQELDNLKQMKQGFLQKMFPKEGEVVPEIRFPGFIDEWERRKLCEIVEITMGQSPEGKNYTNNPNDYILVQGNADIKGGKVVPRVYTTQITKTANKGDLILSVRAPVGAIGKTDFDIVLGRGVAGIKGNEFIYQMLIKMNLSGCWIYYSTGSTFDSINSRDLENVEILIPNKNEQIIIGNFFKQIDDTFALVQQELDLLKETQKAFLQKMFI